MSQIATHEDRFWYFDALDARGGLAFASYRKAGLGSVELSEDYTVHVGPPSFAPEQLGSRALGHAAFRASFQSGLYAEGREVAFASLSSLIEFVRRGYLAGGGGDGANDGGSGVPPQPDEGPSETPDLEGRFGEVGLTLELQRFSNDSNNLKFAAGSPVQYADFTWISNQFGYSGRSAKSGSFEASANLLFALIDLTIELLRRFPGTHNPYLLSRWQASAWRLAHAGTEFSLWDKLSQYPVIVNPLGIALAAAFDRGANLLARQPQELAGELRQGSLWAIERAIFGLLGIWTSGWNFEPPPWVWERFGFWRASHGGDAADDLACWPLPQVLRKSDLPVENLMELLALFTGAPRRIAELQEPAKMVAINLVIFSVAHLNKATDAIAPLDRRSAVPLSQPGDHIATSAAQRGVDWLAAQMPRVAFPPNIERFIGDVADLKYRHD